MTIEQLIAAKARMTEIEGWVAIWSGVALLCVILGVLALAWRSRSRGDAVVAGLIISLFLAMFSFTALATGIYDVNTAEAQARADLANYNLVEVKH